MGFIPLTSVVINIIQYLLSVIRSESETRGNFLQNKVKQMGKQYRIIKRTDRKNVSNCSIDFYPRNPLVPLVGCSDATNLMPRVGDIIGVIFQSTLPTKKRFEASCSLLPDSVLEGFHREGRYYIREEHFFRVSKLLGNTSRMEVEKVFMDGMKIIHKIAHETFSHEETTAVANIKQYRLLKEFMEEGANGYCAITDISVERTLDTFVLRKATEWVKLFSKEETARSMDKDSLMKLRPYKTYKQLLVDLEHENTNKVLNEFLSSVEEHRSYLVEVLGEEVVNDFGSLPLIIQAMDEHYTKLVDKLGENIKVNVEYSLNISPHLAEAEIMQNLKQIKQSQVFRIYDVDRMYCMLPTATVSDWGGGILPESIRSHIKAGCTVRAYLSSYEKNEYDRYSDRVIYFKLLHPSGQPGRFFAQLLNMYLSEYEDIVVEIDVAAITEIPLGWEENEYLQQFLPVEEEEGEGRVGYCMTGLGAAVASKGEDVEIRQTISLYYDIYHLFSY